MAFNTGPRVWIGGPEGRTVYWYDTGRRQRQRTEPSVKVARARANEIGDALAQGRDWRPDQLRERAPAHVSLNEVAKAYLDDLVARCRPSTVVNYAAFLDGWQVWLAGTGRPLTSEALTLPMLQAYRAHLLQTPGRHGRLRTPGTVEKMLNPVRLLWTWADESGRWPMIPRPRHLAPLRLVAPMRRAASWWQGDRMIAEVRQNPGPGRGGPGVAADWLLRLVLLARYTGGRRRELLQLRPADVNLAAGELWLRPETTKGQYGGRVIPLHPTLAEAVAGWLNGATLVQAPLAELTVGHADRHVGDAWTRSGAADELWNGQPLHGLRRSMRTHLVRAGIHGDVVDLLLGHSPQGTGGRVYTDVQALWPAMVRAIHTVPAEGLATEEKPWTTT